MNRSQKLSIGTLLLLASIQGIFAQGNLCNPTPSSCEGVGYLYSWIGDFHVICNFEGTTYKLMFGLDITDNGDTCSYNVELRCEKGGQRDKVENAFKYADDCRIKKALTTYDILSHEDGSAFEGQYTFEAVGLSGGMTVDVGKVWLQ